MDGPSFIDETINATVCAAYGFTSLSASVVVTGDHTGVSGVSGDAFDVLFSVRASKASPRLCAGSMVVYPYSFTL